MKNISESLEARLVVTHSNIQIDNLFQAWQLKEYGELSVVLAYLRALTMIHQQNHWLSLGANFYGDHLLFERLYNATQENIDGVAERCIGLGSGETVDLQLQIKTIYQFVKDYQASNMITNDQLIDSSIKAEFMLLSIIDCAKQKLNDKGLLTNGLDNLLAGIADIHETHIYLLKQRLKK